LEFAPLEMRKSAFFASHVGAITPRPAKRNFRRACQTRRMRPTSQIENIGTTGEFLAMGHHQMQTKSVEKTWLWPYMEEERSWMN